MAKPRRLNPHLYEINCRVWLRRLKKKYNRELTLSTVPIEEWEQLKQLGFDYVWLMGVWTPSRRGADIARNLPNLQAEYNKALPDWTMLDVIGSPYAIISYELNPELGSSTDLKIALKILHDLGLGLILDFVPNHMAVDHPWTVLHPEYFVQATEEDTRKNPSIFFKVKGKGGNYHLAHGKDPYFPPWVDTTQLNLFNINAQNALIEILRSISEECDGIRCDMAMLVLNEIFQKSWGWLVEKAGFKRPENEFWSIAIENIKSQHPDFIFIAEVYWGLNRKLMELGFDYTYDKILYDHLLQGDIRNIRFYLKTESDYQKRCVRFIENHDEHRAVDALGRERSKAAAVIISTLTGLRFFYDGQLEGRTVKTPIQLARIRSEIEDPDIVEHYKKLLHFANHPVLHEGELTLLDSRSVSPEDNSYENLLAWMWRLEDVSKIIIVNYSISASQGFISLPPDLLGHEIVLHDQLTSKKHKLTEDIISSQGLYVKLEPNQANLFTLRKNLSMANSPRAGLAKLK